MDRFWTIALWVILLAALIGVLRYGAAANQLARTFFGWFFSTTEVLAGLVPTGTASMPNYPALQNTN
jgi:hypothetical protein